MELVLTTSEQQSPLGHKLHHFFSGHLQSLRELNDKSMPESERAVIVARIAEAKAMIRALEKPPLLRQVAPA